MEHTNFHAVILDHLEFPIYVLDADGRIVLFNRACQQLTGYQLSDVEDRPVWEILLPEHEAKSFKAAFQWWTPDSFPSLSDTIWRLKNGKQVVMNVHQTALLDGDGTLQYIVCAARNVTQERKREKIIQDRLIHYQHIVETLRNPLAVEDKNGQIISVNHDFCEMVGYSSDELHQMTLAELVAESNRELYQHQLERQRNGETSTYELELTHRDGSSIYILVTATPIFDQLHHYRGTSSLFTNITDYKIAEQDLLDSNAELDAFAHTVAHDLKDPISVLTGFANILEKDFTSMSDSELGEYLQVITRTGDKMINIIDELLLLARMRHIDKVQMQRLNTEEIILQAIKRLQFMIEQYDARIEAVDTENWPQALGYPSWVEEVWVNYISNAIKYGGQPPKVTLGAELAENGMVRFWVKDNGRGIPPDQRNRVFTPFTRLDQVRAKGHGLGLSIVQRIVHKLGGEVSFESAVGEGSVFSFTLPVAAE